MTETDDTILYKLWDFLSPPPRRENLILKWGKEQTKRNRVILNQRIRRLGQMDFELAIRTHLLAGPIYDHIYKLVIHGDVMLRPMLCRGPLDNNAEYTFLLGAIEVGRRLPVGAKQKAAERRNIIIGNKSRRCCHVPIPID